MNALRYLLFPVLHSLGPVLVGFGLTLLVPYGVSLWERDGAEASFLIATTISIATGLVLMLATRAFKRELTARHGFLLVTLTWTLVPLFATVPIIVELPQYSFSQVYFEMMSCLTTTGATMMTGLDDLPVSLNGLRCFLSWLGGMGLIVLSVAILPLLGVGGAQIVKAETSGPMKETKLTPRIADTAKALYLIYLGLSVALTIAYHLAGMSWNDAVMHMMTTVSLSGIAAHDASFAYFQSEAVNWVAVVFMVICGCNFSLHFAAWHRRSFLLYFKDTECMAWVGVLVLTTLLAFGILASENASGDPLMLLSHTAFSVVSVASTTGFTVVDYSLWPAGLPVILLVMSNFACCAASTGGGIKMVRLIILLKHLSREFTQLLFSKAVIPLRVSGSSIEERVTASVLAYAIIWTLTVLVGTILLLFTGLAPLEAFSAAQACLTNLGPGLGSIGPVGNYSSFNDVQLGFCTLFMLLGRLELFTVFILFTRTFWRL